MAIRQADIGVDLERDGCAERRIVAQAGNVPWDPTRVPVDWAEDASCFDAHPGAVTPARIIR